MIPFYIFYSMFGFQRTATSFGSSRISSAVGSFGATAGRTTLTGEGLQHADGHSPLLASTNPACVAYDPAYAYELAHIVQFGLARMYGSSQSTRRAEDVFFYLTILQRAHFATGRTPDVDVEGILRGIHRVLALPLTDTGRPRAQVLASGVAVPWAVKAQQLLGEEWGVDVDVWSVTSWNELRRDGLTADQHNLLQLNRAGFAIHN